MISFRYHIVSIVSVFLALAVGIALGGGPLKGEVDNSLVNELATRKAELNAARGQVKALSVQKEYSTEFATGTAGAVLDGKLTGRRVAVLSLPGTDHDQAGGIASLIDEAGGRVAGEYTLGRRLGVPAEKDLVDGLTDNLAKTVPDANLSATDDTYVRFAKLLARAVGSTSAGAAYDRESARIMAAMAGAGLVTTDGRPSSRADLVLLVAGATDPSKDGQAALKVLGIVATTVAGSTGGVVVVGPTSAARPRGLLASIRGEVAVSRAVSTVDSIDTGAGRVTAVLALADRGAGHVGQFGAVNAADGALPRP